MFHVIGRSLGSDGSCVYRAKSGTFWLYPHSQGGWLVQVEPLGPRGGKRPPAGYHCFSRGAALDVIQSYL